ncbi:uncharacterized protein LOC123681665 [Harmonia axyridis]|uniref:uncharacterized protein LOC123681665 n=1 Tax=Harmonia axyridis TaxID=115357 RepID=UPI001E275F9C|nr:uncharacterized protein LOC123681665 [Harmonia axyridis]XP_045475856.1 uncharacterized protein LOC123681665 [Harmonia axyridis]
MLENNSNLSDDETDSELYEDAIDKEASRENLNSENNELQEFRSSVCIWEDNITPFNVGVYSQILEARVVLSSIYPKCDRACKFSERRNHHIKKVEETVLTCQIANRAEKKRCPICCQTNENCICGKAFIQSKPSSSSHKNKQLCTVCKSPTTKCTKFHDYMKSKSKHDNTDIISLLKDINRIPITPKQHNKFATQTATKSGTNNVKISRCPCKKYASSPSHLSKLSYFSSEELQLVHSIRGSKLTETLKQRPCFLYDKLPGSCTCDKLKDTLTHGKCKFCGEKECVCSKWRKDYSKTIGMLPPIRDTLKCICEKKREEPKIAGTIEEIKIKGAAEPQSASTPSLVKKPVPSKSQNKNDIPSKKEDKETKGPTEKIETQKPKPTATGASDKNKQVSTGKDMPTHKTEDRGDQIKKPKEINKPDDTTISKPTEIHREPEKPSTIKEAEKKIEEKKQPEIPKKTQSGKLENAKETKMPKVPEEKKIEEVKPQVPKISQSGKFEDKKETKVPKPPEEKKDIEKPKIPQKVEEKKEEKIPETPKQVVDKKEEKKPEIPKQVEDKKEEKIPEKPKQLKEKEKEPEIPKQVEVKKIEDIKQPEVPSKPEKETSEESKKPEIDKIVEDVKKPPLPVKSEEKIVETPKKSEKKESLPSEKPMDIPKPPPVTDIVIDKSDEKIEDDKITEKKEDNKDDFVQPDITITIEISDKEDSFKYQIEEKREPEIIVKGEEGGDVSIKETKTKERVCQCHVEELPLMILQKCKPCKTKCKTCSRIPRSTSRIINKNDTSNEMANQKLCHCCNNATNTEKKEVIEKGEQCTGGTEGRVLMCKKCRLSINKANTGENVSVSKKNSSKIKLSKCGEQSCIKRSSTFVCSTKETDKVDRSIKDANGCPKTCRRPSTASKIDDFKKRRDSGIKTHVGPSIGGISSNAEEILIKISQPCSELKPMSSEKVCPRGNQSDKAAVKGKICHCHANINTDRETLMDRGQQCLKRPSKTIKCKGCGQSQTGGTFQQDIIASYVASCSSNAETPPPQQFIIQTLLYQFAGYELNRDPTPPRKRRSLDRSRSSGLKRPSENVMRSIQVQVGPSCPPKCEAAQTVTTFILTDPRAIPKSENIQAVEGKINYVCGPEVPGLRTKLAMNLNQIPSADDSCVCPPESLNEQEESVEICESSICSYYQNKSPDPAGKSEPFCKVTKKDKYIFITVTPVQTDPYEPNYYIIFSTPEDEKEAKGKKAAKTCTKPKQEKSSTKKDPLDRFKNQIFSMETLKSKEFLELYERKQDIIQNAKVIGPSPINTACLAALLDKSKSQGCVPCNEIKQPKFETKGCGPDDCENFKATMTNETAECCFGNSEVTTRTMACGSDHCLHQDEVNKFKSKNAECGPDTCHLKKQKHAATGEEALKRTSNTVAGKGACDACTTTDSRNEAANPKTQEYCDKQVCTNDCEKGHVASQACDSEQNVTQYCDASCSPDEDVGEDECDSSCDPNECANFTEGESRKRSDLKECHDKVCPEKIAKSTSRLSGDFDQVKTSQNDECEDSKCPKKRVNTKLDDKDVFALELAMNRFIRVNPRAIKDD